MKKIFLVFAMVLMLVATSCGNRQANTETEVVSDSTAVEIVDSTAVDVVDSTVIEVASVDTVAE